MTTWTSLAYSSSKFSIMVRNMTVESVGSASFKGQQNRAVRLKQIVLDKIGAREWSYKLSRCKVANGLQLSAVTEIINQSASWFGFHY